MSKKIFSESEMEILRQNPYVVRITARVLNVSAEFKKTAYAELLRGAVYPKERMRGDEK